MPKISQIDEVPCQAEVRILQKITLKKAGNYSVGGCTKYLVVRERNRNKTKLVTLNVTATKGNVRLT